MIEPVRREILQLLTQASELAPELRLGQLVSNVTFMAEGPWSDNIWEIEDEQLLDAFRQHVADLSARHESVS